MNTRPRIENDKREDLSPQATEATRVLLKAAGHDPDAPYFTMEDKHDVMMKGGCVHENHGVILNTVNRSVRCSGCSVDVHPFDALVAYAHGDRYRRYREQEAANAEASVKQVKARQKRNKPFIREVVGIEEVADHTLKAEPIIGHLLKLTCGHAVKVAVDGITKTRTCHACAQAALKGRS